MKSVGGGVGKRGGGGHANSVLDLGGPNKYRIGFGGGGSCKFRIHGKKPVTLHFYIFYIFLFLYNTKQEPLSGIASRGGG